MNDRERVVKNRRRIKFSHVLIALLLVGIAAFAIFRISTRFKLRDRIDAVRAAGYPVTCAELDRWYGIPPDVENAAYTMEEAFLFLNAWDKEKSKSLPVVGRAELPPRTEPLPAEMRTLIAEYVADNNEALELLQTGAEIEDCRYKVDLSLGMGTLMPNLSEMRKSVFLLKLKAILHADAGDGASAKHSAISCFGVARTLEGLPITVAQLVRSACQAIAVSTVEQIVNRTELTDEQLIELVQCVREGERICGLSDALVGERCMGISFFRGPEAFDPAYFGSDSAVFAGPLLAMYKAVGLADADAAIYLDLMDGYMKSVQLPPHERQKAADAVDARLRATSKVHVLLHTIMPSLSRVTTIELRTVAHLRAADAALAVHRYRLTAGKLPDKLADLVPAYLESVPKDPFDGDELRYKKLDPGFVVYSIGEDLSDDAGKERPSKTTKGGKPVKWDVTFIVER
jgi:hypothetical protein